MKITKAIIALAVMAGVSSAMPAFAQQHNLRAAHYFKEDHPWNKALVQFAKRVNEETKGTAKIDIFNGGILGSDD